MCPFFIRKKSSRTIFYKKQFLAVVDKDLKLLSHVNKNCCKTSYDKEKHSEINVQMRTGNLQKSGFTHKCLCITLLAAD